MTLARTDSLRHELVETPNTNTQVTSSEPLKNKTTRPCFKTKTHTQHTNNTKLMNYEKFQSRKITLTSSENDLNATTRGTQGRVIFRRK